MNSLFLLHRAPGMMMTRSIFLSSSSSPLSTVSLTSLSSSSKAIMTSTKNARTAAALLPTSYASHSYLSQRAASSLATHSNHNTNDHKRRYHTKSTTSTTSWSVPTLSAAAAVAAGFIAAGFSMAVAESDTAKTSTGNDVYSQARVLISQLIEDDPPLGPTFVRLAWHASGTYCKMDKSGGSNGGCIRNDPEASHGANAGLYIARDALEKVKSQFPVSSLSYADLYTLAGVVAIEEMGGPAVTWKPGRRDFPIGEGTPDGRLPDADKGEIKATIQHIRDIFYRMGFDDSEIVALLGAHALGRCYPTRSGYSGPWTRAEFTFSNEYFRELLESKWTVKIWDGYEFFYYHHYFDRRDAQF